MTQISPLLKNRIDLQARRPQNKYHEQVYENLQEHANDVKPNDPKARLVTGNPIKRAFDAVGDTFTDAGNFVKAATTGKLNDNSLGRINDLGMKGGALLIATVLASAAKTKTEAIMQFIGGTTFFSVMALWPKLFINLPARIVHGFPIDEKYISAQGDKKDLYLDNQFIPTKLHSEEQMQKEMKRMGIDPKDEFAEEKWLRKRQKTALQNRALWMATAGVATPVLTALIGDFLQPRVENAVIDYDFRKTGNIVKDSKALNTYLDGKSFVSNAAELQNLLDKYSKTEVDDNFFKNLAELLEIKNPIQQRIKNPDDFAPIKTVRSGNVELALKDLWANSVKLDMESLEETLSKVQVPSKNLLVGGAPSTLSKEQITNIIEQLGDDKTPQKLAKVLKRYIPSDKKIKSVVQSTKLDNSEFFKEIQQFNATTLAQLRGRLDAYLKLLNPISGSKSESITTREYSRMTKQLLDSLGITDYEELKSIKEGDTKAVTQIVSSHIKKLTEQDTEFKEQFNAFTDVTTKFLNESGRGIKNKEEYKQALVTLFGDKFPLVQDKGRFEGLIQSFNGNITADNKAWLYEIFNNFMGEEGSPKMVSFDALKDIDFTPEVKEYMENLQSSSTLLKILGNGGDEKQYFANLDELFQLAKDCEKQRAQGGITNEALEGIKTKLKAILGENAEVVNNNKELRNFADHITSDNINWTRQLAQKDKKAFNGLVEALIGGNEDAGLLKTLKRYIANKKIDISYSKAKALICANFERRAALGAFKDFGPEAIENARDMVYNGNISFRMNNAGFHNKQVYEQFISALFNDKAFVAEEKVMPGIQGIVNELANAGRTSHEMTKETLKNSSLSGQIKNFATRLFNNKTWFKKFAPIAIILVATTLLVQPLFGNIKKEYPEDKKAGGSR